MDALVEVGDRSPLTVREYRRFARKGGELAWWGAQSLTAVNEGTIESWSIWMAKERDLSPKTRKHILGAFRTFVRWCKRRAWMREVPPFPTVQVPEYEPTILSLETQRAILEAIPEADRGAHLVLAFMGVRPGEARALTVGDYRPGETPSLSITKAIQGPGPRARVGPTERPPRVPEDAESTGARRPRGSASRSSALFGGASKPRRRPEGQLS
jgi:integrase